MDLGLTVNQRPDGKPSYLYRRHWWNRLWRNFKWMIHMIVQEDCVLVRRYPDAPGIEEEIGRYRDTVTAFFASKNDADALAGHHRALTYDVRGSMRWWFQKVEFSPDPEYVMFNKTGFESLITDPPPEAEGAA